MRRRMVSTMCNNVTYLPFIFPPLNSQRSQGLSPRPRGREDERPWEPLSVREHETRRMVTSCTQRMASELVFDHHCRDKPSGNNLVRQVDLNLFSVAILLSRQSIRLDYGKSWVQILSGTEIFFRIDAISTFNI